MTRLSSRNGSEKNLDKDPRNCRGDCGMCHGIRCECTPRCQSNQECTKMGSGYQCRPLPSTTILTTNTTATIETTGHTETTWTGSATTTTSTTETYETTENLCETAQGAYKEAQKLNEG